MASPTQWMWIWASSGRWWWTGKPGVMQSTGSQRVGHDWVTELNCFVCMIKLQLGLAPCYTYDKVLGVPGVWREKELSTSLWGQCEEDLVGHPKDPEPWGSLKADEQWDLEVRIVLLKDDTCRSTIGEDRVTFGWEMKKKMDSFF